MSAMEAFLGILYTQLNIKQPLHTDFILGFTHNCIFMTAVFFLSCLLSPLVWGKLEKDKHALWHSTVCAAVNPFAIVYNAWPEVVGFLRYIFLNKTAPKVGGHLQMPGLGMAFSDKPEHNWFDYPASAQAFYMCGLTCGYMFLDMVVMAVWAAPLIRVQRWNLYKQMWMHHLLSCIFWPLALCMNKNVIYVIYFNFTELSNPFLNLRWLIENRPGAPQGILYYLFAAGLLLSFFLVRILPIPFFVLSFLFPWKYGTCTATQIGIILVTCPIPFLLNGFWFSLMMRKVMRMFSGKKHASSSPAKENKKAK